MACVIAWSRGTVTGTCSSHHHMKPVCMISWVHWKHCMLMQLERFWMSRPQCSPGPAHKASLCSGDHAATHIRTMQTSQTHLVVPEVSRVCLSYRVAQFHGVFLPSWAQINGIWKMQNVQPASVRHPYAGRRTCGDFWNHSLPLHDVSCWFCH